MGGYFVVGRPARISGMTTQAAMMWAPANMPTVIASAFVAPMFPARIVTPAARAASPYSSVAKAPVNAARRPPTASLGCCVRRSGVRVWGFVRRSWLRSQTFLLREVTERFRQHHSDAADITVSTSPPQEITILERPCRQARDFSSERFAVISDWCVRRPSLKGQEP